ncbi:MAG: FAD/NAD(P)-binding protein [candidate division Zixibacteria bacterium]|nr:FAD/NAD(P)-binding protein [candidate division Zixibacteria bacterium]
MADPMSTQPYLVERVIKETHDTFTMELVPKGRVKNHSFTPGQFNMLYVFGVGEVPISISGNPSKQNILVHTTRAVGNVTKAMWKLKTGDSIGIRGPYGTSWPAEKAYGYDVVIVAGGIGLAPLRPVVYHVLAHREEYGKVVILYGTRTPDDILFRKELMKLRSRFDIETHITVDRAAGDWKGNVGVVTNLIGKAPFDPLSSIAMVCGPEIMMRFTALSLQKRGISDDRIYVSMERNMKCGIGLCGHCQMGSEFICKDGPVYCYDYIKDIYLKREI